MAWHLSRFRKSRYWYARITRPDKTRGNWLSTRAELRSDAERVARKWDAEAMNPGLSYTRLQELAKEDWERGIARVAAKMQQPSIDTLAGRALLETEPGAGLCWLWTGPTTGTGYGRFKMLGRMYSPHRVMLEWKLQRWLARDEDCCHTCDVRLCANPEHLFAGSRSDNMRDAAKKGRLFPARYRRAAAVLEGQ